MKKHILAGLALALLMLGIAVALTEGAALAEGTTHSAETSPHSHDWRYTARGNVITARCEGPGACDVTEGLTLELSAPNDLTYDGRGKAASLKYGYSLEAFGREHRVAYVSDDGLVAYEAPANAGVYRARLTPRPELDGPAAEVTFTVKKAALEAELWPEALNAAYDGRPHPLAAAPEALPEGCAELLYSIDGGVIWSEEIPTGIEAGSYTVYVKYAGDVNHEDRVGEPLTAVIEARPAGIVLATLTARGEDALKLSWTAARNVDGYDAVIKNVKDKSGSYTLVSVEGTETAFTGLQPYNCYKARVRAWVMRGARKQYVLDASPVVYAITGDYARGMVNPGSLSLTRRNVTVKIDRTVRIGGSVRGVKKGTLLNRAPRLRYISSDPLVATVNRKGDVTGVGPGDCNIYALTNNGLWERVKVTVDAEPDSLWFPEKRGTLRVGRKGDLAARLRRWPGRSETVLTWTSSNDAVAIVDAAGVVTGVAPGEASVTVTAANGVRARVKIKVKE